MMTLDLTDRLEPLKAYDHKINISLNVESH